MNSTRMKVMITAGGTREYIDDVRVVTNISSGALGRKIAEAFLAEGAHVFYIHSKGAPMPECLDDSDGRLTTEQFVTCADLMKTMEVYCSGMGMDVVIHSAAVSDFTFKRDVPVKISSDSEEGFIEHLRQTIVRTPKIVKSVKEWCPECCLVSFKFTVGKERTNMMNIALKSGIGCGASWVVANDKEEMSREKEHVAYLVDTAPSIKRNSYEKPLGTYYRMQGKTEIAHGLVMAINNSLLDLVPHGFQINEGDK